MPIGVIIGGMRDYLYIILFIICSFLAVGSWFAWDRKIWPSSFAIPLLIIFIIAAGAFLFINNFKADKDSEEIDKMSMALGELTWKYCPTCYALYFMDYDEVCSNDGVKLLISPGWIKSMGTTRNLHLEKLRKEEAEKIAKNKNIDPLGVMVVPATPEPVQQSKRKKTKNDPLGILDNDELWRILTNLEH